MTIHATCVAVHGHGLLLLGASASGKSDLALRLIDRGALLVADDRVLLRRDGARLLAGPPPTIAGRLEARGVGLLTLPWVADAPVALALGLDAAPDRLPRAAWWRAPDAPDAAIPYLGFEPFGASAPARAEAALALAVAGRLWSDDD